MTVAYTFRQTGLYAGQPTRFGSDLDKTYVNPSGSQVSTVTIVTAVVDNGWVTTITNTNTGDVVSVTYDGDAASEAVVAENLRAAWQASGAAVQLAAASIVPAAPTVVVFDHEGLDVYTVVTVEAGAGAATDAVASAAGALQIRIGRWAARTATASITEANKLHLVVLTGVAIEQLVGVVLRPDGHEQVRGVGFDFFGAGDVPVRDRGSIACEAIAGAHAPGAAVFLSTAADADQGKVGVTGDLDISAFCSWRSVFLAGAAAGVAEIEYDLKTR
jgi:hypothetical protein